jgi:ATP-binding cassette, subfamily C (CFTR/MRP), member 1
MTGWYQHITFRLMAKIRSALIAVIYRKLLNLKYANANESAAVTLMGTEVDRICESLHYAVSEVVPNIVQLGIAVWLLERQLGAVCIAPVIVTLG